MKRLISRLAFLAVFLLPSLAHAQFTHALTTSGASTLSCATTGSGGTYSTDVFVGTLTGSITPSLPAAATNCADRSHIEIRAIQGAGAFTVTTGAGAGTVLAVTSNYGNTAQIGGTSGNVLHQIWIYNKTAATPTWELVAQDAVPFIPAPIQGITTQSISGATNVSTLSSFWVTFDTITMTASATLTIQTASFAGQTLNLKICQNATGGFTPTMATSGVTLDGIWPTFTTTANKCGVASLIFDTTTTATITGSAAQID